MKKLIIILLFLVSNSLTAQKSDSLTIKELVFIHKTEICFCQGFGMDSVILIVNDSTVYSGYVDSARTKQTYQLTHSFSYNDTSKVSLRVIVYMNQSHFEELKLNKSLPHRYNSNPSLDLKLEVYKNLLPTYIYFEGSLDRVYFTAQESEIIYWCEVIN